MSQNNQFNSIKNFIEEKITPGVAAHGGEVNIVSLSNNILTLSLAGSCGSCSVQAYTSESISNYILEEFPELDDVIVTDPE
ncbi:MAG: NifU family protein [Silvanigrellaceae bacterium]|nr:NifU family protein [Silvanigrellaceae bacterium]